MNLTATPRASLWLPIFTGLAAVLRFAGLAEESLWLDEGHTYHEISLDWSAAFLDKTQGPAFIVVEKLFCGQFGTSEWALRMLPACFGILLIPVLYLLTRRLFDTRVALLAALFAATNPTWIHYSQDARPYSLLLLAVALSCWLLLNWFARPSVGGALLALGSTLLAVYTHAYGALTLVVIGSMSLLLLRDIAAERRREYWRWVAGLALLAAVLSLPALSQYAGKLEGRLAGDALGGWITRPSPLLLLSVVHHYFMYPVLSIAAGLVVLRALLGTGYRAVLRSRSHWVLVLIYGSFVVIPWAVSVLVAPVVVPRYTLPASLAAMVVVSWAVAQFGERLRGAWILTLLVISAIGLFHYYRGSDKDPWRQTAQLLDARTRSGDLVIYSPGYVAEPMRYYFSPGLDVSVTTVRRETRLDSLPTGHDRIWLVTAYGSEQRDLLARLAAALSSHGQLIEQHTTAPFAPRNPYALWQAEIYVSLYAPERNE